MFTAPAVLGPAADREGLLLSYETGLYGAADDYRVPDLVAYRPENASDRGVDTTAEVAIELRSTTSSTGTPPEG